MPARDPDVAVEDDAERAVGPPGRCTSVDVREFDSFRAPHRGEVSVAARYQRAVLAPHEPVAVRRMLSLLGGHARQAVGLRLARAVGGDQDAMEHLRWWRRPAGRMCAPADAVGDGDDEEHDHSSAYEPCRRVAHQRQAMSRAEMSSRRTRASPSSGRRSKTLPARVEAITQRSLGAHASEITSPTGAIGAGPPPESKVPARTPSSHRVANVLFALS